ncbi:MAG: SGNH/GDSL hydrolase family protein [Actinomycetota bacterium]|nr:SGNH/GDSL hydrolase family protein [Actinomycetota bacterium]
MRHQRLIALTAVTVALALTSGCVELTSDNVPDWAKPTEVTQQEQPAEETPEQTSPWKLPGERSGHHNKQVLMLGRSVMRGWFDYWEWDGEDPVLDRDYAFYYAELASPPDIGKSAAGYIAQVPDGTVVFFKLCFVDFEANSSADVSARLKENVGYARQVVKATKGRDITLVLGNALPRVTGETTRELVDLHKKYNAELDKLAEGNKNVHVFDLYGTLVSQGGALPKGLAVSPEDSHLNGVGYAVLDEEFFPFLGKLTKE